MTYDELKHKVAVFNFQNFDSEVKCVSLKDFDLLLNAISTPKGVEAINGLITTADKEGLREDLSFIYYRLFFKTQFEEGKHVRPFYEKAFDFFRQKNDSNGVVLLGTELVNILANVSNNVDSVLQILDEMILATEVVEGVKGELYVTSLYQSNIISYPDIYGNKLKPYICDFYKTELFDVTCSSVTRQIALRLEDCCKSLYNKCHKAEPDEANFYLDALEFFISYLAKDGESNARYDLAVYYYNRYLWSKNEVFFNKAIPLFNDLLNTEFSHLAKDALDKLKQKH